MRVHATRHPVPTDPRPPVPRTRTQWPAEITSLRTSELPAVVLERYSTRQGLALVHLSAQRKNILRDTLGA